MMLKYSVIKTYMILIGDLNLLKTIYIKRKERIFFSLRISQPIKENNSMIF